MGYVSKTLTKDEYAKQAKITRLVMFDKFVTAILFILGAVFALVNGLTGLVKPIAVGDQTLDLSSTALACVGAVLWALALILAIYRLIQAIGRVPAGQTLPKTVFLRLFLYGLVGIGVGLVGFLLGDPTLGWIINLAAGLLLGVLIILFAVIRYRMIYLVLTNKRVFGKRNIWRTLAFDIPIGNVNDVKVDFSFWGKMFNYGTVTIFSANSEHTYKYVHAPEEFKNYVLRFTAECKCKNQAA